MGALHGLDGKKSRAAKHAARYPGCGFRTTASIFLYGINNEVLNCSPYSFDLQHVGIEIAFPRH
jgi:hypothetical protein